MDRSFTVSSSSIKESGGRYKSKTPSAAAKKAASKLFAKKDAKNNTNSIKFDLRESTRGSDTNVYSYTAVREKLPKESVRVINGVEIVNKYKIVLK